MKSTQISITCGVENFRTAERTIVKSVVVDQRRTFTWLPAVALRNICIEPRKKNIQIQLNDGTTVKRSVGFAILHVENTETVDEIVFAQKGDLLLLGCRALEGLNLRVDPRNKRLVAGGPKIAASAISKRKR